MKISVDEKEHFTLNDVQKQVFHSMVHEDQFEDWAKQQLQWVLMHKYEQCFKRLKSEWEPKLIAAGYKTLPTDPDEYAELVFKQDGYKNRSAREASQQ